MYVPKAKPNVPGPSELERVVPRCEQCSCVGESWTARGIRALELAAQGSGLSAAGRTN